MDSDTITQNRSDDRRFHERRTVCRRCKIVHRDSLHFANALTRNLSEGGALLEVDSHRPLCPGDEIEVGIEQDERGFIGAEELIFARVVRSGSFGESRQLIAVEYASLADLVAA
ncbi:MAG: PilZ domain-containing protein [Planctomycetes bacterium]|nr:PilZ domain-containing protein [Planctomycetota bacterium]